MDVRLPNGQVISNVPEGTTKKDIMDRLARAGHDVRALGLDTSQPFQVGREGLPAAARQVGYEAPPEDTVIGGAVGDLGRRFATGVGTAAQRTAHALAPLADYSPAGYILKKTLGRAPSELALGDAEEQKSARQVMDIASHEAGGLAKAGEIGTDIATTLIPGAGMYGGLAGKAPSLARGIGAATGTGVAIGGATTPGDIEDRATGAAWGGAGGLAGEVGGRVLKKTLTNLVKPSEEAQELLSRGIVPTVGQGAESPGFKMAENVAAHIPGVGRVIRKGQERALVEWRADLVDDILGKGSKSADEIKFLDAKGEDPRFLVGSMGNELNRRYGIALGNMEPVVVRGPLRQELGGLAKGLPQDVRREYDQIAQRYLRGRDALDPQDYKRFIGEVNELTNDLAQSERVVERRAGKTLGSMREKLNEQMSDEVRQLDESWQKFTRFREAAGYLGTEKGVLPKELQRAVRKMGGKRAFAEGEAPVQDVSESGLILQQAGTGVIPTMAGYGASAAPALLHPATAIPIGAAAVGATRRGAKFAFGQYDWQKALAEHLRSRQPRIAARGGATAQPEEDYQ